MAITICAKIAANQAIDCNKPLQSGTEDTLLVLNYDDWMASSVTYDVSNPLLITNIVLPTGVTGYTMQGIKNSHMPKYEMVTKPYIPMWNHEINYKVFNVSPAAKLEMTKTSKGLFVVLVYNKYKGTAGNAAFEIYGTDAGMICTQMIRDPNNQDNQGAFDIILKSDEGSLEPLMPKTVFDTNYATTLAIVEGLAA